MKTVLLILAGLFLSMFAVIAQNLKCQVREKARCYKLNKTVAASAHAVLYKKNKENMLAITYPAMLFRSFMCVSYIRRMRQVRE